MKLTLVLPLLFAPAIALAACPDLPPRSEAHSRLMQEISTAETEADARVLSDLLWEIWTTAPDPAAQEILRSGHERRGRYDFAGALQAFDKLVEYCPHYAEGYNQRAFINFIRGDHQIALEDLNQAIAITPDHIGAVSGRALVLLELGRTREGQLALREALALNPWLPERGRLVPLENLQDSVPDQEL